MESLSEIIKGKLAGSGWTFEALPAVRDDAVLWDAVKQECGLTTPELSMVKNVRCTSGNPPHSALLLLCSPPH